jgi:WD40 repeat protein
LLALPAAVASPGLLLGIVTHLTNLYVGWRFTKERPTTPLSTVRTVKQRKARQAREEAAREAQEAARLGAAALDFLATIEKLNTGRDPIAVARPAEAKLATPVRRELATESKAPALAGPGATHPPEPLQRIDRSWPVHALSWHPDGRRIALSTGGAYTRVYDISGKNPEKQLTVKGGSALSTVRGVAFSPDGTRLATASHIGAVQVWDAASGKKLLEVRISGLLVGLAFSPDGTRLATASADTSARVWDAASGKKLLEVRHDGAVDAVAFSPDGTRLATASADTSARVWDAASGKKLLEVRHNNRVSTVAFSPDGTRLATGGHDGNARIWSVAEMWRGA